MSQIRTGRRSSAGSTVHIRHPRVQPLNLGRVEDRNRLSPYAEWNTKAKGVVSYGAVGGARAAEHLRLIAGELQTAHVRTNVALSLFTDFQEFTQIAPGAHQERALEVLLNELITWGQALASPRQLTPTD
jgi:NAD(P)H-dependent FMN reductase